MRSTEAPAPYTHDTARDYAILAVTSTTVVASDQETAEQVAATGAHLTAVSRAPGGDWEPVGTPSEPTRYAFLVEGYLTSGTLADYAEQWKSASDADSEISPDVRTWSGASFRVGALFMGYDDTNSLMRYRLYVGKETADVELDVRS